MVLSSSLLCSALAAEEQEPLQTAGVSGAEASSRGAATIVLVGDAANLDELRELLVELLDPTKVAVRFLREHEFRRQALLGASDDDAVHVFIVPAAGRAKLYFRGPGGHRFLLRDVELPHGLDEVGRELVGQIVESSVDALLHGAAGITREQAQSELDRQPSEPTQSSAPRGDLDRAVTAAPRVEQTRPTWEGWTALRYSATFTGDPGVGHGPGFELGLAARTGVLLRARLIAERWFPRSVEAAAIGADIATTRARLAFDLGLRLGFGATFVLSLGAGADWGHVAPGYVHESNVVPAASSRYRVPGACGELRLEVGSGPWQLALGAAADASLADTHYDVQEGGRLVRVADEWQLRPSAVVALGFRPRF
jgi:hypothetical protein